MMEFDSQTGTEFQASYSNYSLLPKKESKDRMSSKSKREAPVISSPEQLTEQLLKVDTDEVNKIKIYVASETFNGESFMTPLSQIKDLLERIVISNMDISASHKHIHNIYNIMTAKLISYLPKLRQSQREVAMVLLDILCLLALLYKGSSLMLPQVFASCLLYLQPESEWAGTYDEVLRRLCHFILPSCLVKSERRESMCLTSVLMMVLDSCSSTKHHLLLIDTLMILKRDVAIDLLKVITYGTTTVRGKALDLLVHYWPIPIPEFRPQHLMYGEWTPPHCENTACRHVSNIATSLCLDVSCAMLHKSQGLIRLYLLLCPDCDSTLHSGENSHERLKLPMPLREIKPNCEFQRICSGKENKVNKAVVTCYHDNCTAIQNGQPIRMCNSCHSKQHRELEDPTHIYQVGLPDPWAYDDLSSSSAMLEAVSKLLENVPVAVEAPYRPGTTPRLSTPLITPKHKQSFMINIETSKRGVWLLSHYCTPTTEVQANQREWLIHLLALMLEWLQSFYDILQAAIVRVEEQLTSAGAAAVAAGAEGQEWIDSGDYDNHFEKSFTNYSEITALIDSHVLYWIRSVCSTNASCVVEALKPDITGCAQVGRMWNKAYDSTARYRRTLTLIYRLDYYHRQGKLDSFPDVFSAVMPLWMDKLIDLRNEPGKMDGLQGQLRLIFATQNKEHKQGLRIFNFIWEKFRADDSDGRQQALFWLQDLTRLNIPLPYLSHMFDDALKEHIGARKTKPLFGSVSSSFDLAMGDERTRKESSGSFSGSDAEPHLLSQSSVETPDLQVVVNLKTSLARYILMLDIWLSQLTQLPETVPNLELSVFQNNLIMMLRRVWGSNHDHREPNTTCYLCHALAVWFGLATRLLNVYTTLSHREQSVEYDETTSPHHRQSTRSAKLMQISRRTADSSEAVGRRVSGDVDESRPSPPAEKGFGIERGLLALHRGDHDEPPARRKMAQVQSHSQFRVVSGSKVQVQKQASSRQEDSKPSTYVIFQLCALKLQRGNVQSEALRKIVSCLLSLVWDWRALDVCEDQETVYADVTNLFEVLWNSLETSSSNTASVCVDLLLECASYLANATPPVSKKRPDKGATALPMDLSDTESEGEPTEDPIVSVKDQLLWKTAQKYLTSPRWSVRFKAAEVFTMVVQFMRRPGATDSECFSMHPQVQASLAHGFCLLVKLLVDKNSNVCARAKYLIPTIKDSSLDAIKFYLKNFFYDYAQYRSEVLAALSLLDSSLPHLGFLSVDILSNLLRIASSCTTDSARHTTELELPNKKKASDSSAIPTPRVSTQTELGLDSDPVRLKITERILSLLLRHIANPRIDIAESMRKAQEHRAKKGATVKGRRSTSSTSSEDVILKVIRGTVFNDLHCLPQDLRKSPVFEVFINHMFPVLDHNIEFGLTKGLLPFVLKMLCFCAAPNQSDYVQLKLEEKLRDPSTQSRGCSYSLTSLQPHLQAPWLRILFIILYKYIHDYPEVDPRSHSQGLEVLTLVTWCLQITLNTLECGEHSCPRLTEEQPHRPPLQKQFSINQFTDSIMEGITGRPPIVNIIKDSSSSIVQPAASDKAVASDESVVSSGKVLVEAGVCPLCAKPTNEFPEEVMAIATVVVGTCCHRLPHTVSGYLVSRIIPAVARVVIPGSFSWQSSKTTAEPPPGSAMAVATHTMASILSQFGDRRLFLFLFGTDYGAKSSIVFGALAQAVLGNEGEPTTDASDPDSEGELNEASIIKYFLEDAISSIRDVHSFSIINLASYMEALDELQEGTTISIQLTKDLLLWDSFFKKLKSSTEVLRQKKAMHAFLRIVIKLMSNSLDATPPVLLSAHPAHNVQSVIQSLLAIIEFALYNVYTPLGGLVELASLWYKLFQQQSHRDAEKLIKLYISELRKALKSRDSNDQCPRPDNILGLIQVLLLEESGYLGYVDGLSTKKCLANDLKLSCEAHSQPVISAILWDFVDVLSYLSATDLPSTQLLAPMKLSLAQLVALRAQHGYGRSPPTDKLKRLVSGDPKALLPAPTTFRSTVIHVLQPRWLDYIKSIHVLSWLLLGAMSHNYIDGIAAEMKMAGTVSGQCKILESLNPKLEEIAEAVLKLVTGAVGKIALSTEGSSGFLYLAFLFSSSWTVYMELYARESLPLIVEFWQKFIAKLNYLLSGNMSQNYRVEVIRTLNNFTLMRLKEINLSCYSLLVPIWRELTNNLEDKDLLFPDVEEAKTTTLDKWLKHTIEELVTLEKEWTTD